MPTTDPATAPEATPIFREPDRPLAERVADLLGRLTLAEKIGQMCNACPAVPRLGIAAYD